MPGTPGTEQEHRHRRRMTARLSALLDGDLGRLRALWLRRHLRGCRSCQATLEELQHQLAALRGLDSPGPEPGLEGFWRVRARLLAEAPRGLSWRAPLGRRAALAGGLSLVAVAALLLLRPGGLLPRAVDEDQLIGRAEERFSEAEQPYREALLLLERRAQDPAVQQRSLQLRVRTTAARHRARSQPADAGAQTQLYQAYRDEIANLLGGR